MLSKTDISSYFKDLQDSICSQLETLEVDVKFFEDKWERPEGGGGRSRVIVDGQTLAKGGVNFSAVEGPTPQKILDALHLEQADFFATGVSIVIHPVNPWVPIIHMNVRYFEMTSGVWWFGGGIDLTPHYIIDEDAKFFHTQLKTACDSYSNDAYERFKKWADDYFYITHRDETRGIGGIFFDHLNEKEGKSKEEIFAFVKQVGETFAPTYVALAKQNREKPYGEKECKWQNVRRSRYVEFNLVLDKGTKFGLDTNGRTESILMSMPPVAQWYYSYTPEDDALAMDTLGKLKKGINWLG